MFVVVCQLQSRVKGFEQTRVLEQYSQVLKVPHPWWFVAKSYTLGGDKVV